ncbi:MAG: sugar phosphate nucleotidyltransferase [Syntrophotaleaceae bacterium]
METIPMETMRDSPRWAVILCGGRGTRLGPFTQDVPKPLVSVAGKPILDYIFTKLIEYGFDRLVLPVGYLGNQIVRFAREYPFPAGTQCHVLDTGLDTPIGARLAQIRHLLPEGEDFLLTNGDLIFDFDLRKFGQAHCRDRRTVTLPRRPSAPPSAC